MVSGESTHPNERVVPTSGGVVVVPKYTSKSAGVQVHESVSGPASDKCGGFGLLGTVGAT